MSLCPYIWFERPSRLLEQDFGTALTADDILEPFFSMNRDYYRPWRLMQAALRDIGSTIKTDKEKFQVNLDVQHFSPEEITVKVADDFVAVEGKHEEKKDEHGYVSRQFVRRYALPEGTNAEAVESKLSSDGVLTIMAPRKVDKQLAGEKKIPITHTGPVRKEIKDAGEEKKEEKK